MIGGPSLGRQEYNQRLDKLASAFHGRYGQVEFGDEASPSGATRKLHITVTVPGWGLPTSATMVFVEKHEWRNSVWVPYDYAYDLHLEPRPSGRFAYHWSSGVFHVHCEEPTQPRRAHHYKGAAVDDIFWAAQALFETVHRGISCHGLQPLVGWHEEPGAGF
jgi:hypothetical protein